MNKNVRSNPADLIGEQNSVWLHTIFFTFKLIFLSITLFFIEKAILISMGLSLSSYCVSTYLYVCLALFNKNIFMMKIQIFISCIETFFILIVTIGEEKVRFLFIIYMIYNIFGIIFSITSVNRAKPEFEYYYFMNISAKAEEIGK
ncbi:hypothetical protein M153_2750001423 [Pseudoloma neurophilia]|uniref:Uncharacterized protein n=1 Tax=Pseudoloma neurophilia TaxID=146866 RepID=A0A0R0LYM1_9MICR|nr:hypothetical protein M153_2750001423 [Pseudoloma neurophilia]